MRKADQISTCLLEIGRLLHGRIQFNKRFQAYIAVDDVHAIISMHPISHALDIILIKDNDETGEAVMRHYQQRHNNLRMDL